MPDIKTERPEAVGMRIMNEINMLIYIRSSTYVACCIKFSQMISTGVNECRRLRAT